MAERGLFTIVYGQGQLRSPLGSNRWRLFANDDELALLRRQGRLHISRVLLPSGEEATLAPDERSAVAALDENGNELARITRTSWFGRRWEITSQKWAYELVSDPRPRRWHVTVGGTSVAQMTGSLFSYNRVTIDAPLGVPLLVVALAWHVIARPWEAAAAPATLIADTGGDEPG
jgi:hypothetical protein